MQFVSRRRTLNNPYRARVSREIICLAWAVISFMLLFAHNWVFWGLVTSLGLYGLFISIGIFLCICVTWSMILIDQSVGTHMVKLHEFAFMSIFAVVLPLIYIIHDVLEFMMMT